MFIPNKITAKRIVKVTVKPGVSYRYSPMGANERPGAVSESDLVRTAATRINQRRVETAERVAAATGAPVNVQLVVPVNESGQTVARSGGDASTITAQASPVQINVPYSATGAPSVGPAPTNIPAYITPASGVSAPTNAGPGDAAPVSAPPTAPTSTPTAPTSTPTAPTSTPTGGGGGSSDQANFFESVLNTALLPPVEALSISDAMDPVTGEGETIVEELNLAGGKGPLFLGLLALGAYLLLRKK